MSPSFKSNICFIEGEDKLKDVVAEIADLVHENGYAVVEPWNNEERTLYLLATHIGNIQGHIRANEHGIVGETSMSDEWMKHKDEYFGVNNEEFNPHTDGSYLTGVRVDGEHLVEINPPRILILQMAQPAPSGGSNYVVDGQRVFKDLLKERPEILKILMRNDCLTVSRDNLTSRGFPVFNPAGEQGKIYLRFRFDGKVYCPAEAAEALKILNKEYFLNPKYQVMVPLKKGQILVCDNYRVLHAREKFMAVDNSSLKRKLRRVWITEEDPQTLVNLFNNTHSNRSIKTFESYGSIESPIPASKRTQIDCGIKLSQKLYEEALRLAGKGNAAPLYNLIQ